MEHKYLMEDTEMSPSMPYPRFLTDMEISSTAKSLYVRLLDKTVSEKETDNIGAVFNDTRYSINRNTVLDDIVCIWIKATAPIKEQMAALSKSDATVKRVLLDLEQAGLLERKRQGREKPNKLYILA